MGEDLHFRAFIIAFMASLPAILMAIASLIKAAKSEAKLEILTKQGNGERDSLIRQLVQDAWREGHLAGTREQQALLTPPPKNPEQPG